MMALYDALTALVWLSATGLLIVCAWRWSRHWQPQDRLFPLLLHTLILAWAAIVVVSFLLAAVSRLTAWRLMGMMVVVSATGLWWQRRPVPLPPTTWPPIWSLVWMVIASLWGGHSIIRGLFALPAGWDSLDYHLPLVDSWLQAENLYVPDYSHWNAPANLELLGLWFVAPFSGDFWIGITNLPVTVMLAVASYQFLRQLGLGRTASHLATLAVVSNGTVWYELITLDTDTAVASLFVASLFYSLRYAREGRNADLGYAAAASGLLAGVKYFALGYAAVAWFAAVVFVRLYRRHAVWRITIVWLLSGLILAGYWYARNVSASGNPFYPLHFQGGPSAVHGGGWQSTFLLSGRPEVVPLGLKALFNVGGPCLLTAALLFPLALVWLVVSGCSRKEKSQVLTWRHALALVATATFGVFLVTPYAIEAVPDSLNQLRWEPRTPVRYGLCWENLTICLAAVLLHDLARKWPSAGMWLSWSVGALLAVQYGFIIFNPERQLSQEVSKGLELEFPDTYLVAANLSLAAIILHSIFSLVRRSEGSKRWAVPAGCLSAAFLFAAATLGLNQHWHEKYANEYSTLFNDQTLQTLLEKVPMGSKVCVMDARTYPFFGPSRQFRVCRPTTIRTEEGLISFLDEHTVPFLVVRSKTNRFAETWQDLHIVAQAVEAFEQQWEMIYQGRTHTLYRVSTPEAEAQWTSRKDD